MYNNIISISKTIPIKERSETKRNLQTLIGLKISQPSQVFIYNTILFPRNRIDSYLRVILTCDVSFGTAPDWRLVLNNALIDVTFFFGNDYLVSFLRFLYIYI